MISALSGQEILGKLAVSRSPVPVPEIFEDIRTAYGVDDIVYHAVNVRGLTRDGAYLRLTYMDDWISQYYENDYFKIDPVVEEGTRAFLPFQWSQLDWSSKKRQDFADNASGHSIGTSGLTVPIRGPDGQHALFSVTTSRSEKSWGRQMQAQLSDLHTLAHHVHQAAIHAEGIAPPVSSASLSARERDVLQWTAAGKTNDDVATILGIAERTVRVYLDTARHKLGATNRTHAVARALGLGLIHPPD